jgi:phosphotransferase system HPr (HPr) family protein
MKVVSFKAVVKHENGLHAANSAKLVQSLSKFNGEFQLLNGRGEYDMKSILGLMSLALFEKHEVEIRVAVRVELQVDVIANVIEVLEQHFELSEPTVLL